MAETKTSKSKVAVTSTPEPGTAYLQWGAIFGGIAIASAISFVLAQFGTATGLTIGDPVFEDGTVSWAVLVAGLWTVLVAITSASTGGYLCGRMRARFGDATEDEVEVRDGIHGLVVWAGATLIVIAFTGIAAALGAIAAIGAVQEIADVSDDVLRLTTNNSVIFAFATAAGAALAAAAAWFGAVAGGNHRDQGLSIHEVVPKRFRKTA
ncbi:MAG: hypothetical protein JJ920_06205 [Roseitalea sp.]|jgi:hypothetical protein|nr:hypothetical protein [Roseitalea sp.]MBO6723455.1 hypothetical protein [Roseitalea sp.]MBO6742481.1 hypothetical protein [Roseitalea sp.]